MTLKTGIASTAVTLFIVALSGSVALAETLTLKADLSPSSEVPANTSTGVGSLTGTYDTDSKTLIYTVTYSGLTGPAIMAHFHAPAPIGKNSGVEIPIKGELASPIKGTLTLNEAEAKNLTEGLTYFNIHTAANKGGELRGQVSTGK